MVHLVDMVSVLTEAAFVLDQQMRIVDWSDGAHRMFGYEKQEVVGKSCGQIFRGFYPGGEPLCSAVCAGESCFRNDNAFSVKACMLRHKDGNMVPVNLRSLSAPNDPSGDPNEQALAIIFIQERQTKERKSQRREPLRISTLGRFSLVFCGSGLEVDTWSRKSALTVLKYLVTHINRPVHRERLIETLWPDAEGSRGWDRLKVAISFLRSRLREAGLQDDIIATVDKSYMLRGDMVWVDARAFESLVAAGHALERKENWYEAASRFEDAKRLYAGDYLEDEYYSDWCATERERLREMYFEMLAGTSKCQAALGNYLAAAQACREALYRDQSRESFLHSLIECLNKIDRADWAKPQLDIWQRVMTEEFKIVPKPEQLQMFQDIIAAKALPEAQKA